MENKLYGVDLDKEVTPMMARDALIECFNQAHCEDSNIGTEDKDLNESYCTQIVKKSFLDTDSDFDNPNKEMIKKVMDNLKLFSENFRDKSIIDHHYNQMLKIVNKINE